MQAHTPAKSSDFPAQPSLSYYNGMGWGPCEAPTYAGEYKRQELQGESVLITEIGGIPRKRVNHAVVMNGKTRYLLQPGKPQGRWDWRAGQRKLHWMNGEISESTLNKQSTKAVLYSAPALDELHIDLARLFQPVGNLHLFLAPQGVLTGGTFP